MDRRRDGMVGRRAAVFGPRDRASPLAGGTAHAAIKPELRERVARVLGAGARVTLRRRRSRARAAPVGIGLVVLAQLAAVSPTNFGGYDEWLIVQLTSAGQVSIPYAERPLELVWDLPAPFLFPHRLEAFLWLHGVYLWLTGVLVWRLFARLAPGQGMSAFLAGIFAAAWAPSDFLRLNAIETVAYSGVTFVVLAAATLLLEAWTAAIDSVPCRGGGPRAVRGADVRERAAPALRGPRAAVGRAGPARDRRLRWRYVALWEAVVLLAGLLSVAGVLLPTAGSYQLSALSLDLHPVGVLRRLAQQAAFHLAPAVAVSWPELRTAHVAITTVTFLARRGGDRMARSRRRSRARPCPPGVAGAGAGGARLERVRAEPGHPIPRRGPNSFPRPASASSSPPSSASPRACSRRARAR